MMRIGGKGVLIQLSNDSGVTTRQMDWRSEKLIWSQVSTCYSMINMIYVDFDSPILVYRNFANRFVARQSPAKESKKSEEDRSSLHSPDDYFVVSNHDYSNSNGD